ncbi:MULTISPECIES: ABC transporter ATP-binding protein [Kocuria]|uniref:ABC transporter ATP-binding protein n=1 Tax=Kocuria TaxID=57493 RepID=UPI00045E5F6E|nr:MULTISPECIES: ABC transporter ATP-binding protein [Kocuria]GLU87411.1 ABC transporter ATP-binding protein [Kocuria sp. NBRC 114282]
MPPSDQSRLSAGSTIADLRVVFTLVPWRMRWRIIAMAVAALLAAMLDLVAVAAMLPLTQMLTAPDPLPGAVDRFLVPLAGTDPRRLLILTAVAVGAAFLVKNVAVIAIRWWSIGQSNRASAAVQAELLRRYAAARYVDHRLRSKSAMTNMVGGAVPAAFSLVLSSWLALLVDLLSIVLMLGLLVAMSPIAAAAALVVFGGFAVLLSRYLKPWSLKFAHRAFELDRDAIAALNPAIEGFRETRLFQREELFVERYRRNKEEAAGLARFQSVLIELPRYLLEVVMILGILLVALLLFGLQGPERAFGLLAVFVAAAMRIVPALNRVVASNNQIHAGTPALRELVAEIRTLEQQGAARRTGGDVELDPTAPLRVRDLGFRFPDGKRPVLEGVSVDIPAGSTVALVGGSGAGKTTFADLLAGLYEPSTGSLCVGGVDLTEHPGAWLPRVAMVSQRVYLWDASIRDLITFAAPAGEIDERHLADVLEKARLTEVVESLPHGLDTTVGEAGTRLSGGQTQRLGIARALYSRPSVLILDEATSALDNETERQITETVEQLHGQLTVIVIAHRLSTVKNADQILYFAEGRLRASGTMSELVERDPDFAHLVELGRLEVG